MADDTSGERTEQATGRRRSEARKKGQVAKSREIPSVLVLISGMSVLYFMSSYMYQQLSSLMVQLFHQIGTFSINPASIQTLNIEITWSLFLLLAPLLIVLLAVAFLGNYVQVGSLFSWEVIQPNISKINPFKGFTRLFSRQSVVELLKSLFKILIIGWAAFATIQKELPKIMALPDEEVGEIFRYICLVSFGIFWKTFLVMIGLAALDYIFQRWSYEKSLRMTKREVQEEFKQTEGDPLIKSRIRSIQRELARRRMMAEIPKADVIITNPTHLAVALQYKTQEMNAPKVLAKGAGFIAEKIKEIGRAHQIPIVENKPLAQVLFKTVDLGQMIPSVLYQVVADLLAYVYRMKNRKI